MTVESLGLYKDFNTLCCCLEKAFKDVAKSPITTDEEGSVLYLVKRSNYSTHDDQVLSLCKLKTIEYRIFRKMREKLRGYFKHLNSDKLKPSEILVNAFKREMHDIIEG